MDDRHADEQARAARRADEGWSFTRPSSTMSLHEWRAPSTLSGLAASPASLAPTGVATTPTRTSPGSQPSSATREVLEKLDLDGDEGPMLPIERAAEPTGLLAPPPLVTQSLVPHEPVAGQVLGLQQHPGSLPQPSPPTTGWRPPQLPQLPGVQKPRAVRTPSQQASADKGKGQIGAMLGVALMAFAPALFGLGMDAWHELVPPTVAVEPAQPVDGGALEVTRDFGTFTVPAGWDEVYDPDDSTTAGFTLAADPETTLSVTHVDRVEESIEQTCADTAGGEAPRKLSTTPVIGGAAGVAYRAQNDGYTSTVQCAASGEGVIILTGTTRDTPQATIDEALDRIASSLH